MPRPYYDDNGITIYHGDCREIAPQLQRGSVDMLIADPPYGIGYVSNFGKVATDRIVGDDRVDTLWLASAAMTLRRSASVYVFAGDDSVGPTRAEMLSLGWRMSRMLVWDKQSMTAGGLDDFGGRTEFIVAANAFKGETANRMRGPRASNLISVPGVGVTMRQHPTEKPTELMAFLIIRATDYDEVVFDPFMGSGPVVAAAQSLGRRAIGIEIEERYCEIAAKRLSQKVLQFEMSPAPAQETERGR